MTKMAPITKCPLCLGAIKLIQISFSESVYLCINSKCNYPLDNYNNEPLEFVARDYEVLGSQVDTSTTPEVSDTHDMYSHEEPFVGLFDSENSKGVEDMEELSSLFESLQQEQLKEAEEKENVLQQFEFDKYLDSIATSSSNDCNITELMRLAFGNNSSLLLDVGCVESNIKDSV